jgi:polysaccharide biosynthesis protein PslH
VHRVPYPPNRGDRIRSYHLLKHLAERADVSLATLADEPVDPASINVLRTLAKRVAIEPVGKSRWLRAAASLAGARSATEGLFSSPKLRETVRQWSRETRWDAVLVFCSSMVQYTDLPELSGIPVVVDLVDVDSQKFFDYAKLARGPKRWLYQLEGRRLRRLECSLPGRAKAITLVSEPEAALYRSFCPNDRTLAVSNGVDLDYFRPQNDGPNPWKPLPDADRTNLVFVGALDYHANVDGVTWFAREVWPLVRREMPGLTLGLVGRNPVAAIRRLAVVPGIRIFANVPDVRPHLAAADIAIAPLRVARGVQNKVLEAMAMGKALVGSDQALQGIKADEDVTVASNWQEWPRVILQLLKDRRLLDCVGSRARAFVESHCAWSTAVEPLTRLVADWPDTCLTKSHAKGHLAKRSELSSDALPSNAKHQLAAYIR